MRLFVFVFLLLNSSYLAMAENVKPPTLDQFLIDPFVGDVELSPDGKHVALVKQDMEQAALLNIAISDDENSEALTLKSQMNVGPVRINWVKWVSNKRLLVSSTNYVNKHGNPVALKYVKDPKWWARGVYAIPVTRLYFMDADGSNLVKIFEKNWNMNRNFYGGGLASILYSDADHVMIYARLKGDLDLFKINIHTAEYERVAIGASKTVGWYLDRSGAPAFRIDINWRRTHNVIMRRETSKSGNVKWKKFKTIKIDDKDSRAQRATEFKPLAPGPELTTFYVAARPEHENTTSIYLYDFEKDEYIKKIKSHPTLDITGAVFSSENGELVASYFYDNRLSVDFQDSVIQEHFNGLDAYFGNEANIWPIGSVENNRVMLLRASGPRDPGSYHVYFKKQSRSIALGSIKADLSEDKLAPMEIVKYIARDGLEITGYYTRPINHKTDAPPPLIMLPHGGPEVRDIYSYNQLVQILASQGYAVFQPNFRGSSGKGLAFVKAGHRQWGKAMQTDIEDGYNYLVSKRLASDGNACVLGYSYGGYASLMAGVQTPKKYRCIIAGSAVTDLISLLKYEKKEEGGDSDVYKYWLDFIGDPVKDKLELNSVSPQNLVSSIDDPVLIIHGKSDSIVPIEHAITLEKSLKKHSKYYEILEMEHAGHSYRSDQDERLEYETILKFLAKHLPTGAEAQKPYLE